MEISRRELEANVGAVERIWASRVVRAENGPASGRRQIDLRRLGGLEVTLEPDQPVLGPWRSGLARSDSIVRAAVNNYPC